eukprot:TRINITY_DN4499_c0_g1_i1.p1 TRINITY_DN4499_c0_g1~~TRINITY_DN4499_c0_g1_i1.p1  ORF type:complete len:264 (-),score=84.15 TRINITY_DN4499_c0_g1_i1:124-915(-)
MSSYLTKRQKNTLTNFKSITGVESDKEAIKFLRKYKWNVDNALGRFYDGEDSIFTSIKPKLPVVNKSKIKEIFEKYCDDSTDDKWTDDGMIQFFEDLEIDTEGLMTLAIPFKLKISSIDGIEKSEFVSGMEALGIDTMDKFRVYIPTIQNEIDSPSGFNSFYNYIFNYAKGRSKNLAIGTSIFLWEQLNFEERFNYFSDWCDFLNLPDGDGPKAISKDTWSQLLNFASEVSGTDSFENWDENAEWPWAFDVFVEYMQKKQRGY